MNGRQAHRLTTYLMSVAMIAVGVALVVEGLIRAPSPLSPRLLLGVLFVAAGCARGYLEIKRGRRA